MIMEFSDLLYQYNVINRIIGSYVYKLRYLNDKFGLFKVGQTTQTVYMYKSKNLFLLLFKASNSYNKSFDIFNQ